MTQKLLYTSPKAETLVVQSEGVICESNQLLITSDGNMLRGSYGDEIEL